MTSIRTIWRIATCIAPMFMASPCGAAFGFLWMVNYECNPQGLPNHSVWRIYASFTNPGDRLTAVYGNVASPMTITSTGGFYQNGFGGNLAPDADVIAKFPLAAWDTFCTIGLAVDNGTDQTSTTPGFPPLPVTSHTNMAWFVPPAGFEQGAPDSGGKVLIAQLTLLPGSSISQVSVGLSYRPAGSTSTVNVNDVSAVLLPLTAGDLNHDLQVNMDDLLLVVNGWGQGGQGAPDANDDGFVNIDDLLIVINHWGAFTGSCP